MLAATSTLALWNLPRAGTALVVSVPAEPPDAIVPLASHEWERLPAAVALAQQYPASLVLLTVPAVITDANCHRCTERSQWLIDRGIVAGRIHTLPDRGNNTHDEAAAVRKYAEQHPLRRLAVVTSPYHTRRALATFRETFRGRSSDIGVYPACSYSPAHPRRWWANGYDRSYVAYEWAALLYYRFRFDVPLAGPEGQQPLDGICFLEPRGVRAPSGCRQELSLP